MVLPLNRMISPIYLDMVCEWLRKRDATMAVAGFLQAGAKMPALNGKFSEGLSVNFEGWGAFENDWRVADFCEDAAVPNRAALVVASDGCGVIMRSQTGGLSPHPSYGWRLRAGEERTRAPRAGLPVLLSAHDPEGVSPKRRDASGRGQAGCLSCVIRPALPRTCGVRGVAFCRAWRGLRGRGAG